MVQVVSFNITKVAPPFDRIDAHASMLRTLLFWVNIPQSRQPKKRQLKSVF